MDHVRALDRLEQAYKRLMALRLPKNCAAFREADADVDLYEEDSHLAGLAQSYLSGRPLVIDPIVMNRAIDTAIEQAGAHSGCEESVRELREYRAAMLDLATALSEAAGLPLLLSKG